MLHPFCSETARSQPRDVETLVQQGKFDRTFRGWGLSPVLNKFGVWRRQSDQAVYSTRNKTFLTYLQTCFCVSSTNQKHWSTASSFVLAIANILALQTCIVSFVLIGFVLICCRQRMLMRFRGKISDLILINSQVFCVSHLSCGLVTWLYTLLPIVEALVSFLVCDCWLTIRTCSRCKTSYF